VEPWAAKGTSEEPQVALKVRGPEIPQFQRKRGMQYPSLFQPFSIRGLEIPNRILMAPMGNNLSDAAGIITPRSCSYYAERAKGGAGMLISEAVAVNLSGRHRAGGLCLFDRSHEEGMGELVEAVHREGGRIAVQLNHGGRLCDPAVCGGVVVGPSEIQAVPGKPLPQALSIEDIRRTVSDFVTAAERAFRIGFDAIEIHGAHGYLIHQFFSLRSNRRDDEFGGNLENRMRFHLEIVRAVREGVGKDLPLIFRLSANEYEEGGYTIEEALALGKALKEAGVDILHISAGTTERAESSLYCIQPHSLPQGCLLHYATRFRNEVGPPVIGVGRLTDPDYVDRALREQMVDLVAMGRSLLADPHWPNKAAGRSGEPIRPCIGCNNCIERISHQNPIDCTVNPCLGREEEKPLKRTAAPKHIFVVGAGPAGLEAACTAAAVGHRVRLYEKEDRVGGQLQEAGKPPSKSLLLKLIRYYESLLSGLKVECRLGETFTADELKANPPDVIILATGSQPIRPDIPGILLPHVVTARDVLLRPRGLRGPTVIAGGGLVGCETAEFLAEQGAEGIRIVEMLEDVASDIEPRTRLLLLQRLKQRHVEITTCCRLLSVHEDHVIADMKGREISLPARSIVLALGSRPHDPPWQRLPEGPWEVYRIGDLCGPGSIKDAVHQGRQVVMRVTEKEPVHMV
jgi:2,4-dienoyl-CoA reductase-like NADH-dependent reductase (Old Yellow Enzyme family)